FEWKNDEIIPPAVAIFSPSKAEIQQKSKATLVCLASGFYPDHLDLVWKVNGATRTEGVGTDEFSTRNGSTYSLTSRLRISAQEWFNPSNRFELMLVSKKRVSQTRNHKSKGCGYLHMLLHIPATPYLHYHSTVIVFQSFLQIFAEKFLYYSKMCRIIKSIV
uniref:Ig-like domain-containing protein n=1 Tax=Strigops habroptila TaxID=2489341 RepID=A0A672U6G1_STRHB